MSLTVYNLYRGRSPSKKDKGDKAYSSSRSPSRSGRDRSQSFPSREAFGDLIYEIVELKEGCLNKLNCCAFLDERSRQVIKFFEKVVIIQNEEKCLFFPPAFTQQVFPKYRISGINISRAAVPKWVLYLCVIAFGAGIYLAYTGDKDDNDEYMSIGIALSILGPVLFVILPFLLNKYYVTLYFSQPAHRDCSNFLIQLCEKSVKSIMNPLSLFDDNDASGTPKTLTIVTKQKPDGPLLMEYVYGSLGDNMSEIHQLTHLMQDQLSDRIRPVSIDSLRIV